METIIVVIFILGYLAITLEHTFKIDKLVPALLMMALAWACVAIGIDGFHLGLILPSIFNGQFWHRELSNAFEHMITEWELWNLHYSSLWKNL